MNFESAYYRISELIDKFEANEAFYCSSDYVESKARAEFIDEFFIAMGWDVRSINNTNPYELEVDIEKSQVQEDSFSKKRADYAFFKAPNYKQVSFFVEAKKPSRLLNKNKEDYFQTAKYGYNSSTGISVLTDFQEFVILDCRFKPEKDTILSTQIEYFNYLQFRDKTIFAKVYWLFSKEAVQGGKLQTYLENLPVPKKAGKSRQLKLNFGTYKAIDHDFLEFIELIRLDIAKAVYHSQPNLKNYELTEAVQKILDRLVFIRFLEDKSIESDSVIEAIYNSPYSWAKFVEESKRLNAKYNGIVFKEAFFDHKDFLSKDNKPFKDIVFDFSANESPYNFNYIPIEIIGNIYERFLGKTIEVQDGKLNIDYKQQVRKACGVFYTPTYIVEYIVKNTVGKLIEGKTPKEIAKMSFADISCGSGSFLIGVYDYLLQYHTKYYNENPDQAKKDKCGYNTENRVYYLTLNQKKQILLNNIYGVDIDSQATEVAQLSLFLKLLENENLFSTDKLDMFGSDKILPNLTNNIKCGNTLIGMDFYAQTELNLYNEDEQRKINVFDFEPSFPKVFQNGGFDAIVGNPPYVVIKGGRYTDFEESKEVINYYKNKFQCLEQQINVYIAFVEQALKKIKHKGVIGYIIPNTILTNDYCEKIRSKLIYEYSITILNNVGTVFQDAVVEALVLIVENKDNNENLTLCVYDDCESKIPQDYFKTLYSHRLLIHLNESIIRVLDKCFITNNKLNQIAEVWRGLTTGNDKKYLADNKINNNYKQIIQGKRISRYMIDYVDLYVNYLPEELDRPRKASIFERAEKIVSRFIGKDLAFSIDYTKAYVINTALVIYSKNIEFENKILLSILNSKLINFLFKNLYTDYRDVFPIIKSGHIEQFPIPQNIPKEKEIELIRYVDTIMELKKQLHTTLTDSSKERLQNQINSIEFSIDRLVYSLYDLSSEDIEVIESSLAKEG